MYQEEAHITVNGPMGNLGSTWGLHYPFGTPAWGGCVRSLGSTWGNIFPCGSETASIENVAFRALWQPKGYQNDANRILEDMQTWSSMGYMTWVPERSRRAPRTLHIERPTVFVYGSSFLTPAQNATRLGSGLTLPPPLPFLNGFRTPR